MTKYESQTMTNTLAALWMGGAIISFTSMAIAGRSVSDQLDTFEIMLYRSIIGLFVVSSVAIVVGTYKEINLKCFNLNILRNLCHFVGQNLWFFALPLIPLTELFALEFTTPIWVLLLASIFLRESLTKKKIFIATIGFFGIIIIARPSFDSLNIGIIAAALSAIGFAGAAIITRKLTVNNSFLHDCLSNLLRIDMRGS